MGFFPNLLLTALFYLYRGEGDGKWGENNPWPGLKNLKIQLFRV